MRSALVSAAALALVPLTMAWNVELPPCLDEFKPFVNSGCFQDGNPPALMYRSDQDQKTMTVEKCVAECKGNGFRYAGLKYYGVCFCGATVNGPQVDDSQCSFPCSGNKTETCGSNKMMSVWQDPTFPKGPNDTTINSYESVGCYTDDSKKGRALSWPANLNATTFTTKECLTACEKEGFTFAGTEYGGQCWCGAVLANDTAKVDDKECNMPCKRDAKDICGGRSRLSLYVAKDLESLEPCGYKPPAAPPVPTAATTSTSGETTTTKPEEITTTTKPEETTTTTKPTETTTTKPTETTTTKPEDTTTTTKPEDTTTTKPKETTTTTKPSKITASYNTTTTKFTTTTTTATASLCTATQTLPPKCEWKCGNWCAPPLPDWGNKLECLVAAKTCALQVVSCFKYAGWPNTVDCFDFQEWCGKVQEYCFGDCAWGKCGKGDCWNKLKPGKGNPPNTTATAVYPCPPATSTNATTTTQPPVVSCPPEPTNICTQPTNDMWGYGPGKPVGGIPLPVVGCNDQKNDWTKNPFKFYTEASTFDCPSFPWPARPNVCVDACNEQYQECRDTYVNSCNKLSWKVSFHKRFAGETDKQLERRWSSSASSSTYCAVAGNARSWTVAGSDSVNCWGWGGNTPIQAELRCKAQWADCLAVNKWVNPGDKCKKWCDQ
ncbi:putative fungistatic metabolite [Tolypocladium ophioglossoides CBS 100239]|uniref:Putative fungistatic metabolite n=1 Tax=Tolypocladium ophioglossoides (strain CBS 100239) TaxID=1163406 RepID=A0A0L0NM19_TOLOC|nr:putative fungistatic metabolite [Tolypocladium ophioglossoides CBS 100239]